MVNFDSQFWWQNFWWSILMVNFDVRIRCLIMMVNFIDQFWSWWNLGLFFLFKFCKKPFMCIANSKTARNTATCKINGNFQRFQWLICTSLLLELRRGDFHFFASRSASQEFTHAYLKKLVTNTNTHTHIHVSSCIHTHTHTYFNTHTYIHTYTYTYTYLIIYTCIQAYISYHIYMHTSIHTHIYISYHTHTHTHSYDFSYIHAYIHTLVLSYAYTHTHTHTHTLTHIYTRANHDIPHTPAPTHQSWHNAHTQKHTY